MRKRASFVTLAFHSRSFLFLPSAALPFRREAEKAKRVVSTQPSAKVELDSLVEGVNFVETLTRSKFEDLNKDLFKKTIDPVKKVLADTDTR
jgi:endoplasmic reticulum chaperone BiP